MALLVGVTGAITVLTADLLMRPRMAPPLVACVSSVQPTSTHLPQPAGDPSIVTYEELVSHTECTDRLGVPLALVAFVTSTVEVYRRTSRQA